MPVVRFTDLVVRALKPGLYYDEQTPAFALRVGTNRKTWLVVKTRKRLKIAIGHYPELSLADARKKALVVLGSPLDVRPTISFPEARDAFLDQPRWRPQSKKVLTSSLRHFAWKRPLAKITHEDVIAALEAIEGRSARAHALKDLRTFFNWCVPRYLASSPCQGIRMEPQPSRTRVLSKDELRAVWQAAETMGTFGTIVRLLMLTGQRKMEIGSLRWSWIGKDAITLPPDVTKNGREHTFPLCPLAASLLPKSGSGLLFRATDSDEIYNGYTYHLRQLQKTSQTSGWTLHDLRRTVATNLASIGTPIHVTEKILNHVSGSISGVAAIYNRHAYSDEMRLALQNWEERVQHICTA